MLIQKDSSSSTSLGTIPPLPRILQLPLIRLIDEQRRRHEARCKIPSWWKDHVARFALSPDRLTHPESGPFLLALVYWSLLLLPYLYSSSSIRTINIFISTPVALAISFLAYQRKLEVTGSAPLARAWTIQHLLIPFTSLFYFGREMVAWWIWESGGRHWTHAVWSTEGALRDILDQARVELEDVSADAHRMSSALRDPSAKYTLFIQSFAARCRTESPYLVEHEGEELRHQLLHAYLAALENP